MSIREGVLSSSVRRKTTATGAARRPGPGPSVRRWAANSPHFRACCMCLGSGSGHAVAASRAQQPAFPGFLLHVPWVAAAPRDQQVNDLLRPPAIVAGIPTSNYCIKQDLFKPNLRRHAAGQTPVYPKEARRHGFVLGHLSPGSYSDRCAALGQCLKCLQAHAHRRLREPEQLRTCGAGLPRRVRSWAAGAGRRVTPHPPVSQGFAAHVRPGSHHHRDRPDRSMSPPEAPGPASPAGGRCGGSPGSASHDHQREGH